MAGTCIFCGTCGRLTGEHVFGNWLRHIGFNLDRVAHVAGPLNRIGRDLGVTPPFRHTVRDVCGQCNNGWMNQLECVAQRVLTPFILGRPGTIDQADQGAIAAWVQKTALVAMLVSSEGERAGGYGLPESEYRELYDRRNALEALSATQMWIGRYTGQDRAGSTWVTPQVVTIEGVREPDYPQGYAMTVVLGELVLQGVRYTTPSLQVELTTQRGLPQLWPTRGDIRWPGGTPVDHASFLRFAIGREFRATEQHLTVRPWKAAVDLADSRAVGSMVELPTICGEHVVYYPGRLVLEAMRGRFYVFITSCACKKAYLIHTEADGAHCRAAGAPAAIGEFYEGLPGEEYIIHDEGGSFVCKRQTTGVLPGRTSA